MDVRVRWKEVANGFSCIAVLLFFVYINDVFMILCEQNEEFHICRDVTLKVHRKTLSTLVRKAF